MPVKSTYHFPMVSLQRPIIAHASLPETADIVIIGGGMTGMTLAVALADVGFSLVVIDREQPPTQMVDSFDGRASALSLGSQRILESLGLWAALAPQAGPIRDIRVTDGPSRLFLHFDHRESGESAANGACPALGSIVPNQLIRHMLFDAMAQRPGIAWLTPAKVRSLQVERQAAVVTLNSGAQCRASLVIGADGRESLVRQTSGILSTGWDYRQTAIVTTVHHPEPHQGVAHERFLDVGPFALLPLRDPNLSSIVWTEKREHVAGLLTLNDTDLGEEMTHRFGPHLGPLTVVRPRWTWPLRLHHATRYVAPRIALVGDAAHGMHPIAGQGLNLGWRDVAVLAEVLTDARRLGQDIGDLALLERYERWQRPDVLSMLTATDALSRLFASRLPPVRLARDMGLALVDRMPGVKQILMRHAMGLNGRLPRLANGQPL